MSGVFQSLINIVSAANAVTAQQLGADGQQVVVDAVQLAESVGGTGPQKFATALAQAGTDLFKLGKDVSLYTLNLAIESAVTAMNSVNITAAITAANTPTEPVAPAAPATPASGT